MITIPKCASCYRCCGLLLSAVQLSLQLTYALHFACYCTCTLRACDQYVSIDTTCQHYIVDALLYRISLYCMLLITKQLSCNQLMTYCTHYFHYHCEMRCIVLIVPQAPACSTACAKCSSTNDHNCHKDTNLQPAAQQLLSAEPQP